MSRRATTKGQLLRHGFLDADAALPRLERLGLAADPVLALLGRTADPDRALASLVSLLEVVPDPDALTAAVADDEGTAMRLLSVLGASEALGRHLCRHPEQWRELTDPDLGSTRPTRAWLRACLLRAVGADPVAVLPIATRADADAVDALRVEYRRLLLRLAARDLAHHLGVDDVAAELSDLAVATLDAALAVARQRVGAAASTVRLAVIALGKCGGHELNYVSDVDVVFVYESAPEADEAQAAAANRVATQLASHLIRICSEPTREGEIWQVDAALRPEGKAGPLVRTLASHVGYYERWASTWEFQALLKARPAAGDLALGEAYVEALAPLVWRAAERDGFVEETRAMRRRVVEHIPARDADRQLKLGEGGLRDVEFAVQLLQLVHGRADEALHAPATLSALAELTRGGYLGREDGEALHRAYEFLRTLEHRLQLFALRRTHVVPRDPDDLRRLGRAMGFLKDSAAALEQAWADHRREVRRLHQKLFYRPLLGAVARIPGPEARLSLEAAEQRLAALGYADPAAALRHLDALTAGVSRTAAIQRTLLPVLLQWFADGHDPDAGLFGFRRISESLGDSHWYLQTLRDEGQVAERLACVLSRSQYATSLLEREPQGVRMLGGPLEPVSPAQLLDEMRSAAARRGDPERAVRAIRAVRRRELFRLASGELLGLLDVADLGAALSRLTDATLEASLEVIAEQVRVRRGLTQRPARLAVVAMGRYGGFELSYGSDADVLFVHEPLPHVDPHVASGYAQAVAHELRRQLGLPGADPALVVDADLRPEGRQGPLVRTLDAYAAYYAKWSQVWEAQALLRADAVVGDPDLRERFTALIDPLRYPAGGLSDADVREIRRIKARVDEERLPRGADRATHLKLGRGGLADIEWTVQLLQLRHAADVAGLRTPRTLPALAAAGEAGLLEAHDVELLCTAWRHVSRVRNAVTLVRGRPGDQMPSDPRERAGVARVLGYPAGASGEMLDDHLRITRQAGAVVDRVFWE
ncbi:bifunctional [glutamine synthetase] adenylyltransferase/[glutamine synthetase]-adenylyl-L-tyrosine phosphorylase [Nocardioides sp. TRM66260-LWL]|uniref:bifunctional [glutamine synthetase] adenylyltransferase/[glutamine synthetase]-adenylyl-L-tyrosine phosphorylase n=1 Tax=Nocardioides sp. TRM66260-LWL TaxID=2874478 RepID=UPI001CC6E9FD|nr:bifunctional [glutamine synthetase] adenylyltransferase/[glutamine synthetase]-adenylyl-L-tyrosine phosphorylase [Nocardioides sp. TRM66260-LWL]MBZ5733416.1 bifunctional [glutamine synthetase] adenylyltransferase/[glutamine synthetase]-adenylyl-L-tyrosine phosphorylase [Nocardioides sp. TRM66260-LWL]